jgi:hypothetical protein
VDDAKAGGFGEPNNVPLFEQAKAKSVAGPFAKLFGGFETKNKAAARTYHAGELSHCGGRIGPEVKIGDADCLVDTAACKRQSFDARAHQLQLPGRQLAAEAKDRAIDHGLRDIDARDVCARAEQRDEQPAAAETDFKHSISRRHLHLSEGEPVARPRNPIEPRRDQRAAYQPMGAGELAGQIAADQGRSPV